MCVHYMDLSAWVCVLVNVHVEAGRRCWMSSSISFYLTALRQGVSLNQKLTIFVGLADH